MTVKFHLILKLAFEKGYRVTEDGKLFGLSGKELLIKCRGDQRYPTFSIKVGELTTSGVYGVPVHKFAAYCFYGNDVFEERKVVRHLDANVLNVCKDNLVLVTSSENQLDKPFEIRRKAAKIARAAQDGAPNRKFTDDQVRRIRERAILGETGADIARDLGVTRNCIYLIINRRNYANVN